LVFIEAPVVWVASSPKPTLVTKFLLGREVRPPLARQVKVH